MSDKKVQEKENEEKDVVTVSKKKVASKKKKAYSYGEPIDGKLKIEVTKDYWENYENQIKRVLNTYTTINLVEQESLMKYLKELSSKGNSANNFKNVLGVRLKNIVRTNKKEEEFGIIKKRQVVDPKTKILHERDVLASVVDCIAKICVGIDPFDENQMYMVSCK